MQPIIEAKWSNVRAQQLIEAIEIDCEAIARLLQDCGSSRNFGLEQQRQFAELLRHRQQLTERLESLRKGGRSNKMISGE